VKVELAPMILSMMNMFSVNQLIRLFTDNVDLFISFLELGNKEVVKAVLCHVGDELAIEEAAR
jgi:hypothetical protein